MVLALEQHKAMMLAQGLEWDDTPVNGLSGPGLAFGSAEWAEAGIDIEYD